MECEVVGASCKFIGVYGKIYTLADEQGNVFYIGSTTFPLEHRLAGHISEAKCSKLRGNKRKIAHIRSLGFKVVATVIDMKWISGTDSKRFKYGEIKELEMKWISKYRQLGYELLNHFPYENSRTRSASSIEAAKAKV